MSRSSSRGSLALRSTAALGFAVLALAGLAAPASAKIDNKEFEAAKKKLGEAAAANDVPGMVSAIQTIGKDSSKRSVDLLVSVGLKLDNFQVYEAVRDALQGMDDQEGIDHMVKTLKSKKGADGWDVACVLLDGCVPHKGEAITQAMCEHLDHKVPYVISAAAKALGKRKDPAAMPALIEALEKLEKSKDVPWIDTKQALTDITGQDFADAQSWADYWKVTGPDFDPTKDRGDKTTSTTVVRDDEASQFFKEQIVAKRIMFIIDVSGSMEAEDPPIEGQGGGKRIDRVRKELIKTIQGLKKDVSFNVIAYSDVIKSWQRVGKGQNLHKATPENKAAAIKWVEAFKAEGATHTDEALEKSFELLEVNTIVLLSDGAPAKFNKQTGQPENISPQEILDKVKGWNRVRGVKIHTFCFEVFKQMAGAEPLLDFMDKLATENGGKMTLIR
jgi:hypothetical protein